MRYCVFPCLKINQCLGGSFGLLLLFAGLTALFRQCKEMVHCFQLFDVGSVQCRGLHAFSAAVAAAAAAIWWCCCLWTLCWDVELLVGVYSPSFGRGV